MACRPSRLSPHASDQNVTRHLSNTAGTERQDPRPLAALDPHGLLVLSHTLFSCAEQSEILRLAMRHVSALGPYHAEAGYLVTGDGLSRVPGHDAGASKVDDARMKEFKATIRCIPIVDEYDGPGKCIVTGETVDRRVVIAKAY